MKISLNWLKEFVEIPKKITADELADVLTVKTVEIEGVEKQFKYLNNVVVGKIKKIENHPNADKLKACYVDIGEKEDVKIICGGNNLEEGMFSAVAKVGSVVSWHGKEEVKLKKIKIRGEESNGMICTSSELGLEYIIFQKSEAEIINLGKFSEEINWNSKIGKSLVEVLELDDIIFEVDNKSMTNRPDLWGHYGIARELAAIYKTSLNPINFSSLKGEKFVDIKVDINDTDLCPRYMVAAMSGIKIGDSPLWMQIRLIAAGMRPINNIVDITNYVMLELGQPMHAFCKSKVESQKAEVKIVVRRAKQKEKFMTLDGEERELDKDMLVIADNEKAIAIAGVMGGANSEIAADTETIIIESANFDKINNRKTASKLGLRTEASMRYEKGLDPNLAETALKRCMELIAKIIPSAKLASDIIDVGDGIDPVQPVEISINYIVKKMGQAIEAKKAVDILISLGFDVKHKEGNLTIEVPSWRAIGDVSIADDIVEEVARIYGYDNIKPEMPEVEIDIPEADKEIILEREIKNILSCGCAMTETSNYSFVNEKQLEKLGYNATDCIKLKNPLSSAQTLLRPSLIPNLLENAKSNARYFDEFKIFEIGSVFKDAEGDIIMKPGEDKMLPKQDKIIAGIVVCDKNDIPFYKAKSIVEKLLRSLNIKYEILENEVIYKWQHPYRKSKVQSMSRVESRDQKSKVDIGYISELNPAVAEDMGIKNARVGVFNLSLRVLAELSIDNKRYKKISKYPSVERDLAIVLYKDILYKDVEEIIKKSDKLIEDVELFDIFESDKLGKDKKSMAFHITFHSDEKTLTDEDVEKVWDKMVKKLKKEVCAEIRG